MYTRYDRFDGFTITGWQLDVALAGKTPLPTDRFVFRCSLSLGRIARKPSSTQAGGSVTGPGEPRKPKSGKKWPALRGGGGHCYALGD